MSRIIVKNLPHYFTNTQFREHFATKGEVTDAKIMTTKNGRSRKFGFIGYRSDEDAHQAVEYFNKTFIDTMRITVELAKAVGAEDLPRPWSKYSKGFTANVKVADAEKTRPEKTKKDIELEAFLEVMKSRGQSKTWENDDVKADKLEDADLTVKLSEADKKDEELYEDLPTLAPKSDVEVEDLDVEEGDENCGAEQALEQVEMPSEEEAAPEEVIRTVVDEIMETGRLFLRNLSFTCVEEDIRFKFERFGPIAEIHVPLDKDTKRGKGYAYVTFVIPEHAVKAYTELDNKIFQGRLLHILPAKDKKVVEDNEKHSSEFKKKKAAKLKESSKKETSWNSLFMSQDAVADAMANRLNVEKSDILDVESSDMAVRLALAETHIIQETTDFLEKEGVCIDAFKLSMKKDRSDTVLLVKNIPFKTSEVELREIFSRYGDILRLVLPPTRTIALVEYSTSNEQKAAFNALAYKNFHGKPLLLEKAPVGVFSDKPKQKKKEEETQPDEPSEEVGSATLFVKNLNFDTKQDAFAQVFSRMQGYRSAKISTKKDGKSGKVLSMGFGFVEFDTRENAMTAIKLLQNTLLDNHALQIKMSDRKLTKNDTQEGKEIKAMGTKLLVRNVPFEATKKDLTELFGAFGQLKRVRLPKRMDNKSHRGFAFIDFLTKQEAKNAFENLAHTHIYGRHLVLEWAQDDESIDAIREKTKKLYNESKSDAGKRKFDSIDDEAEEDFE